jgi:hypothetical protein
MWRRQRADSWRSGRRRAHKVISSRPGCSPSFFQGFPESGPFVAGDRVIVSLGDEGIVAYSARPDDVLARGRDRARADDAAEAAAEEPSAGSTAAGGELLWRTPCGIGGRLVAVVGERVWFADRVNRLASVDLATGEPRECMPLGGFTLPVINPRGDRLVLASPDGLLVSLVPRRTASALPAPAPGGVPTPPAATGEAGAAAGAADEPPADPAEDASRT